MQPEIKAEFKRLWKEAEQCSLSHEEFLELVFNAAVKLHTGEWKPAQ